MPLKRRRGLKFERLEPRVLLSVQPTGQPLSKAQADVFMQAHQVVLEETIQPANFTMFGDFDYQPEAQASLLGPVTSVAGKDLTVTALSLTISGGGTTAQFGDTIQVNYTLRNDGDTAVTGQSFFDAFYLSLDTTLDVGTDISLNSIQFHDMSETIAAGASADFAAFVTLRGYQGGAYNLFIRADDFGNITEADETNNTRSTPITITTPNVDLEITSVTPSAATVTQGDSMTVTYVTRNNGTQASNHFWYDRAYLSTDNVFDSGDSYLTFIDAFSLNPIAAGASKSNTSASFTVPTFGPTGNIFLIVVSDEEGNQGETNENNNWRAVPITVLSNSQKDLIVQSVSVTPNTGQFGDTVEVTWTVKNNGTEAISSEFWTDRVLLSGDAVASLDDRELHQQNYSGMSLAPGETYTRSRFVTLSGTAGGALNILVQTDGYLSINEQNETNNVGSAAMTITIPAVDLVASNPTGPATAVRGTYLNLGFDVTNAGTQFAGQTRYEAVYLSDDAIFDPQVDSFLTSTFGQALAASETYTSSFFFAYIPEFTTPGAKTLFFVADYQLTQGETNETNNVTSRPITIEASQVDLRVESITAPAVALAGTNVTVTAVVKNYGTQPATYDWYDLVELITGSGVDAVTESSAFFDANEASPLAPGATYTATFDLYIPFGLTPQVRTLQVKTDYSDNQHESDNTNNTLTRTIDIQPGNPSDLIVESANVPTTGVVGQYFPFDFTVRNQGAGQTRNFWQDRVFLSTDTTLSVDDLQLSSGFGTQGPLNANGTYTINTGITLPSGLSGFYYLLIQTDGLNAEAETNENNNVSFYGVTISGPDLQITQATAPATGQLGSEIAVTYRIANTGTPAVSYPEVRFYLSGDANFDLGDIPISSSEYPDNVPAGGFTDRALNLTLPSSPVGARFLLFVADPSGYTPETNDANNTFALPITLSGADLQVTAGTAPASAITGQTINISYTVKNLGDASALGSWSDGFYLSDDAIFGIGDQFVESENSFARSPLAVNGEYTVNRTVTLPDAVLGNRFLLFVADAFQSQAESNDANNFFAVPLTVQGPDLAVSNGSAPANADVGTTIAVSYRLDNLGANALLNWYDRIWLSNDATLDFGDTYLTEFSQSALVPFAAGANTIITKDVTIPGNATVGNRFLIVQTDNYEVLHEVSEANNVTVIPIAIGAPDLVVSGLNAPSAVQSGQTITISWNDVNNGNVAAAGSWYDNIVVRNVGTNQVVASTSISYNTANSGNSPLAVGGSLPRSVQVTLPDGNPAVGQLEITVTTDAGNQLSETNGTGTAETNNIATTTITGTLAPYPDLTVSGITVPSGLQSGQTFTVSWTDNNAGTAATGTSWYDRLVVFNNTTGQQISNQAIYFDNATDGPIAAGGSKTRSASVTLPDGAPGVGDLTFTVTTDTFNGVFEYNAGGTAETNNTTSINATSTLALYPDLQVSDLTATPSVFVFGTNVVTNMTAAPNSAYAGAPDGVSSGGGGTNWGGIGNGNVVYDFGVTGIRGIDGQREIVVYEVDGGTIETSYQVLVSADGLNYTDITATRSAGFAVPGVSDYDLAFARSYDVSGFAGTARYLKIVGTDSNPPGQTTTAGNGFDLDSVAVNTSATVQSGQNITVSWNDRNTGTAATSGSWSDRITIVNTSTGQTLVDSTVYYDEVANGPIAAGGSKQRTFNFTLPHGSPGVGNIQITIAADTSEQIFESNAGGPADGNNSASTVIASTLAPYPDLTVSQVVGPTGVSSGGPATVRWTVTNTGTLSTPNSWHDRLVVFNTTTGVEILNTTIFYDINAQENAPLAAGGSVEREFTFTLPDGFNGAGDLQYTVTTDTFNAVLEVNAAGAVEPANNAASVTGQSTLAPYPDLAISNVQAPGTAVAGGTLTVSWTVTNSGDASAAGAWSDYVYLSLDGTLTGAILLGTFTQNGPLAAGASYNESRQITLGDIPDGNYRVLIVSDRNGSVYELEREANNSALAANTTQIGRPDLAATITSAPANAVSGDPITVNYRVQNLGTESAPGSWLDRFYLSTDAMLDGNDRLLGEVTHTGPLAGGAEYTGSIELTLPLEVSGSFFVLLRTDAVNAVNEFANEGNNLASSALEVQLAPYADLVTSNVTAPALTIGDPAMVTIGWTVTNNGTGQGRTSTWTDRVIASPNATPGDGDDIVLGSFTHTGFLAVGASYSRSQQITLPPAFEGQFHLFVVSDATGVVFENFSESNNAAEAGNLFAVAPRPYADLVVQSVTPPAGGGSGKNVEVSWVVKNQGIGVTDLNSWYDAVYLTTDPTGATGLQSLGIFSHSGVLGVNGTYTRTASVRLPDGISGDYYFVVEAGYSDGFIAAPYEFIYGGNNTLIGGPTPVTLTPAPDLKVTSIVAPPTALSSAKIDVQWTVLNDGNGLASGGWIDRVFLENVGNSSAPIIALGSFAYTQDLIAGVSYTRSEQFTLPRDLQGVYRVVIETNDTESIYEGLGLANNTQADDASITVSLAPKPDLQVSAVTAPASVNGGASIALQFTVRNQGTLAASGQWKDRVYLSLDNSISQDDLLIGELDNGAALGIGEQYQTQSPSLTIPRRYRGPVFLLIQSDATDRVDEFPNDGNNVFAQPLEVIGIPPSDLVTSNVVAPTQVFDGSTIELRYKVTNSGAGQTDRDGWTDAVWLTVDNKRPDPRKGDILIATFAHNGSLQVGEFYDQIVNVAIPPGLSGQYFITPHSDAYDVILEDTLAGNINPDDPNELDNNNYKARPITVLLREQTVPTFPDLITTVVTAPASAAAGTAISVSWSVKNQGQNVAGGNWEDLVFLSQTPTLNAPGANAVLLGRVGHSGSLDVNGTYSASANFLLSPVLTGQYIVVVAGNGVSESNSTNNGLSTPTVVTNAPADLRVQSISVPEQNFSGETAVVQWVVKNFGAAVWTGTRYWTDQVFISPDATFIESRATLLGNFIHTQDTPLGAGESYAQSREVTLPQGIGGNFYIYVITNPGGALDLHGGDNGQSVGYYGSNVFEDPANNLSSTALPVTYREPDLQVANIVVPATAPTAGDDITVSWTVSNNGNRTTRQTSWIDRVYLSRDPSLDSEDQMLGAFERTNALDANTSYTGELTVPLPDGIEGQYYILVFSDSNLEGDVPPSNAGLRRDFGSNAFFARVAEFQGEGNNITAQPLTINAAVPPDLRVTQITAPAQVTAGQLFSLTYQVTNTGAGATAARQTAWDDLIYISRDQNFDPNTDRYLGTVRHTGGLAAGANYSVTQDFRAPRDLTGPFYVFVVTDPARYTARGEVFEANAENNNASPSPQPVVINLPPPADLRVDSIVVPSGGLTGTPIHIEWTAKNYGVNAASGTWTDAVYLSADGVWDINDKPLGKVTRSGAALAPGATYSLALDAFIPTVKPGNYRIIVRTDIFNEVFEGPDESNNKTASADTLTTSVESLQMGVTKNTTLSTGQERLFQITVPAGQTFRVRLATNAADAANELFIRFSDVPNGISYDAAYEGPIQANQVALIPSTTAGTYYVLVRGLSEPNADTAVTVTAELVPFGITSISPDIGGDAKFVTTTIRGAQFQAGAIVKLVRPGIAELEPERYEVVDGTKIVAIWDFTGTPHGLYDLKVINPNGDTAILPYRYLVERAIEPDVDVGLGGPRVIPAGQAGLYGFSLTSRTNIDTPYVYFTFGIPELGTNPKVFDLPYVVFSNNLRGAPEGDTSNVPWASLDSTLNTSGTLLAPGYAFDLAARGFVGRNFSVQTYPGLTELLAGDFNKFRDKIYNTVPELRGQLDNGPQDLDNIAPGLTDIYNAIQERNNPLSDVDDSEIAFRFHILASATVLTRDEFVAQQTDYALRLRDAILADTSAPANLITLAANPNQWTAAYLGALEDAGYLRASTQAPPIRSTPLAVSLSNTLATGLLLGPSGAQIITDGNLVSFFTQVRKWYGHNADLVGSSQIPAGSTYDLGLSHQTHFEAFNIFVPYGKARLDEPELLQVQPVSFDSFFSASGQTGRLASITGPTGTGAKQFVPVGTALPYTVSFENPSSASSTVAEIRVLSQLDPDLDPRSFTLGDIKLGDISVHIPGQRSSFSGDFDFTAAKGYVLRVSAALDYASGTATWLFQAIDPETGEVIDDPSKGLLPPNTLDGAGAGFVSFTVTPKTDATTGAKIDAQARVLFNNAPPQDTLKLTHTIDAVAPTTTLTATPLTGTDFEVKWTALDDEGGAGVKHVTVYVAEDGGSFTIWQKQTTATSGVYQGRTGHTYEFLALATDNAGNREQPKFGLAVPSDGSTVNLGTLPDAGTGVQPGQTPPAPSTTPSTNPIFTQALNAVPAVQPSGDETSFNTVVSPFIGQAFATGFTQSHANIGPMALALRPDGSLLISGGAARNQLFVFNSQGGAATTPLTTLPYPIFDLAFDSAGQLWVATGGGPLLQLDPTTGAVLGEYGDGVTQALAVEPGTDRIFVSSGTGVEIFDPIAQTFSHFSDVRVGSLAFEPGTAKLWAAAWPSRGDVVRFDNKGKSEVMLRYTEPVDSISFGPAGSALSGLLFVSENSGDFSMVDLVTLQRVAIGTGGTRGDVVRATADGRVFLSQSTQVDQLSLLVAPSVISTNPAPDSQVVLPRGTITVTFDQSMRADSDGTSVLNPLNYSLRGANGLVPVRSVSYDAAAHTVTLGFDSLAQDAYTLTVSPFVQSSAGLPLGDAHVVRFTAVNYFTPTVNIAFTNARSDRSAGTVSYDVVITNTGDYDLPAPLTFALTPKAGTTGFPVGATFEGGVYLLDLTDLLGDGVLSPNEALPKFTLTLRSIDGGPLEFSYAVRSTGDNALPTITSSAVTAATVGQAYTYDVNATDPDGIALAYLLNRAPDGMTINAQTGVIAWTPTASSPTLASVTVLVSDSRGGMALQDFTITVAGVNRAPVLDSLPATINGREGEMLEIAIGATDADNDALTFWADHLPSGAVFDPQTRTLRWTPGANSAGTYNDVRFIVTDGTHEVVRSTTLLIAATNQAPTLTAPAQRTIREGDTLRFFVNAADPEGSALTFSSQLLPLGATLDPATGLFQWTPGFTQAGSFEIPFSVSDGTTATSGVARITVLNDNAAPVFEGVDAFQVVEGQRMLFRVFAFDADNPSLGPIDRNQDNSLALDENVVRTVSYSVSGLPAGATFDADTGFFDWTPGFSSAGLFNVTFTATDTGDGTGLNASSSVTVPVRVLNQNRAPVLTEITNRTIQRGDVIDIPVAAADADGNPLTFTATSGLPFFALPGFITFTDNGNGTGVLHVAPGAGDRGNYTITVKASDNGDGGGAGAVLTDETTFVLTVESANEGPQLAYVGNLIAVPGEELSVTLRATDLDSPEPLSFSSTGLPPGATLTPGAQYGTAVLAWTPTAGQFGTFNVTVTVTDTGNGVPANVQSSSRSFTITSRASNSAPVLAPIANQTIAENQNFSLTLSASDSDNDTLTFSATGLPQGAALNPQTGVLTWTPNIFQAGIYEGITVTATDGNKSATRTFSIVVTNLNQAPVLVPLPLQSGREGAALQFTLTGADIDGDTYTFSAISGLPAGATLNPTSGLVQWTPGFEQAGNYTIRFGIRDAAGLVEQRDVAVSIDNINRTPTLSVSDHQAKLGQRLTFTLAGADADAGAALAYFATGLPEGATFDVETGEFDWVPGAGQAGEYVVLFGVSDGEATTTQVALIKASVNPAAPNVVIELTPSFPSVVGQRVLIHATAIGVADITGLAVSVDGQTITLDANGRGQFTPSASGRFTILATATDADGLTGSATTTLKVRDTADTQAPLVSIDSTNGSVIGTVSDTNLDSWQLEIARFNTSAFTPLASGNTATNGALASLDPQALENGFYVLRLTASDISGRTSTTSVLVEVNTATKTLNYTRTETDLNVNLGGVTLNVVRAYS